MKILSGFFFAILFLCTAGPAAKAQQKKPAAPAFLDYQQSTWVDSVFNTLSPDERIAQLIVVAAYSNRGTEHQQEILKLIREQKIGGLIFFQGEPQQQASLINEYQQASKVPLLMALDGEWGLGMRLDNTISYPFQMTLGAIQDNTLLYQMGSEVARQFKRAGLHLNFAPVVDVNNNPANPVINYRSFGEDKYNVAEKSIAYMRGMQDMHILTTAKHFPGHGDTDADSHYALPQINHSRERLDSLELYPFRELIKAGVGGMMVAHLNIPALDPAKGKPSTLSKPIVTDLLQEEMGFEGLVVTDAMNMKGVTASNPPGVVDKDAILAGNDMLEFTEDVPRAIAEIRRAIRQGQISQQEIDRRCRKILAIKQWVGLNQYKPVSHTKLLSELNTPAAALLNRRLMEAAITLLKNEAELLPLRQLDTLRIASLSFGTEKLSPFQKSLSLYTDVAHFQLPQDANAEQVAQLKTRLRNYNLIIGGIHDDSKYPRNSLKLSVAVQELISELSGSDHTIMAVFKNPYVLDKLNRIEESKGLIITYQDSPLAQALAAQLIFGGINASGRLPVSVGSKFKLGAGMDLEGGMRFTYTLPEDAGMDSGILSSGIDSLVRQAMDLKAIPGCQVLVAKDQKIVFHKAYGYHDYSDTIRVKETDLYDLASVTKISTGLPALMKLYDKGSFNPDATLANYLPRFKRSNKADIPLRDILTHQGRLTPWIPFWKNMLRKNGSYKWFTVQADSSSRYPIKLSDHMYLHRNYPDKMVKAIRKSPLLKEKKYVYSDFFFILAPRVVESMVQEDFNSYVQQHFYAPLGATTVTYNPAEKFPTDRIVPTEHDYLFRHTPIHGLVHDEGAIMMGGISGHAGLFANANDLAKLMQMYLNMGEYGGQRFIKEETLKEFSRCQFPEQNNHRGLGFDKPLFSDKGISRNTARDASRESFGHTGFTGTFTWMDPEHGLLYIFLSNRVNPSRENTRLYRLNTRTNIQQVLYDAMMVNALPLK
jgi:beta-N-acetylhexosaminidase